MTNFILLLISGYLLGSIPTGYLAGKIVKGIDIRKIGSGSTSATNTARALGWKWGAFVGIFDVSKGAIPAYFALNYLINPWQIIIVALLPIFGHIFPVWLKFHGGRGAATFFGAAAILIGPKVFLSFFVIWIIIILLTRIMSLTNLLFPWILSILLLVFNFPFYYFAFGILGASLITFALRENIKRLKEGKEPKIELKKSI